MYFFFFRIFHPSCLILKYIQVKNRKMSLKTKLQFWMNIFTLPSILLRTIWMITPSNLLLLRSNFKFLITLLNLFLRVIFKFLIIFVLLKNLIKWKMICSKLKWYVWKIYILIINPLSFINLFYFRLLQITEIFLKISDRSRSVNFVWIIYIYLLKSFITNLTLIFSPKIKTRSISTKNVRLGNQEMGW